MTVGCAGRIDETIREQAAKEWTCEGSTLEVKQTDGGKTGGKYQVSGCGKSDEYEARCFLMMCSAQSRTAAAAAQAKREQERAEYEQQMAARREREAAEPPSAAAPDSGPKHESVSLLNKCNETVLLWRGTRGGSGQTDRLGKRHKTNMSGNTGDKLWIVDSHGSNMKYLAEYTYGSGQRDLYIAEDCVSFTDKY